MANYPSFGQDSSSVEALLNDTVSEYGANNKLKIRSFRSGSTTTFLITHILTTAERNTLDTFFSNNTSIPFNFTWAGSGVTHSCIFSAPIQYSMMGPGFWNAQVSMIKV